jgi:hypothetical protein
VHIQGTLSARSGDDQCTFRGRSVHIPHMSGCAFWSVPHSVNVQGTFSECSGDVQ